MAYGKAMSVRLLLIVPISFLLAAVIVLSDPFYRALAVAGLVIIEILRDALSISEVTKSPAVQSKTRR